MQIKFKRDSGLTLIEILIATIVLMIGVVGVLALFPSAIKTTKYSVDDTICAKIAESVADALTIAMRSATAEDVKGRTAAQATIVHDGLISNTGDTTGSYTFSLPLPTDPPPGSPQRTTYPSSGAFWLGTGKGQDFIKQVLDSVKGANTDSTGRDPTESYDQYGFTFTVSRVDDSRDPSETGANFRPNPLYQFAISIYRVPLMTGASRDTLPQPLKVFVLLLSGR